MSVHRSDCTNIEAMGDRTERMIEVGWGEEESSPGLLEDTDHDQLSCEVWVVTWEEEEAEQWVA